MAEASASPYAVESAKISLDNLDQIWGALPAPVGVAVKLAKRIIAAAEAIKSNRKMCDQLRDRLLRLMLVVLMLAKQVEGASTSEATLPLDLGNNIQRLERSLQSILEEVEKIQSVTTSKRKRHKAAAFFLGQSHTAALTNCSAGLDWAMREFHVSSHLSSALHLLEESRKMRAILTNQLLHSLPRANYAGFNCDRPDRASPCFAGTRTAILQTIFEWIVNPDQTIPRLVWLDGMAGVGKTTIARTIAELSQNAGLLGGQFFFSRRGEAELRDPALVFPTIAYQLARFDPEFGARIIAAIEADPDMPYTGLKQQLEGLIINPLSSLERDPKRVVVIVFDAFDECELRGAKEILQLLAAAMPRLPFFLKIFVTSRPERHIRLVLAPSPNLRRFALHDIEDSVVQGDIRLYLEARLRGLPADRGLALPRDWVKDHEIDLLAEKAGNLFFYATILLRFVSDALDLRRQLVTLLDIIRSKNGDSRGDAPYVDLDNLYLEVFQGLITQTAEEEITIQTLQPVLGSILLLRGRLPLDALQRLVGPIIDEASEPLSNLHSIIFPSTPLNQGPCIYHPSLSEFIQDNRRCTDERFWIDREKHEARVGRHCLELLHAYMHKWTPGDLHATSSRSELEGRGHGVNIAHGPEFLYACRHWASHAATAREGDSAVIAALETFAAKDMLPWIKLMVSLGDTHICLTSLEAVNTWAVKCIRGSKTTGLLNDGYRLLLAHLSTVNLGAQHIVQSILPFLPRDIHLTSQYESYATAKVRVLQGKQQEWPAYLMAWEAHSHSVNAVVYSFDGSQLATASDDNTVRVWDAATGRALNTLEGHSSPVNSIGYSLDNTLLASASDDQSARLWDVVTGGCLATLMGHSGRVRAIAHSPDSTQLASGSDDGTVRLCAITPGRWLAALETHSRAVRSVAYSPDGTRLASSSEDGTVRMWDTATNTPIITLKGHSGTVGCAAFSPDSLHLSSGSDDKTVRTWDATTGTELVRRDGHTKPVTSIAYSSDGSRLVSGSEDKTVRVWDTTTDYCLSTLQGHSGPVTSVTFSPYNAHLASASSDKTVRLWDVVEGRHLATLEGHSSNVRAVTFSPDGSRLASGSDDQTVLVWNGRVVTTGEEVVKPRSLITLEGHSGPVTSVAYSPDGLRLASGSNDRTVRLWSTATSKCLSIIHGHRQDVKSVIFSPDGLRLASGSGDNTVQIWDNTIGGCIAVLEGHSGRVRSVVYSPDGTRLASGSDDETAYLWDTTTGKSVGTLTGHSGKVTSLAYSSDGSQLASGSDDETVRIWNATTGIWITTLQGHSGAVTSVTYSPDGLRLASGSKDATVCVWDTASGVRVATLKGHSGHVTSVAFAPYGSRLASASNDRTVRVWDMSISTSPLPIPPPDRRRGHSQPVVSMAFSTDGLRLASGSADKTIQLWDTKSGDYLTTLHGHSEIVTSLAFCSDLRLASASEDKTVRMWDTETGVCIAPLKGHLKGVTSITSTPDGCRLASASKDTFIRIWDTSACRGLTRLKGHTQPVNSMVFHSDGVRLVSGSDDGTFRVWDTKSGACLDSKDFADRILSVALRGLRITSQDSGGKTCFWNLTAGGLTESTEEQQPAEEKDGPSCRYELKDGRLERVDVSGLTTLVCVIPVFYHVEVSSSFVPDSGNARVAFGCQSGEVVILDVANPLVL